MSVFWFGLVGAVHRWVVACRTNANLPVSLLPDVSLLPEIRYPTMTKVLPLQADDQPASTPKHTTPPHAPTTTTKKGIVLGPDGKP